MNQNAGIHFRLQGRLPKQKDQELLDTIMSGAIIDLTSIQFDKAAKTFCVNFSRYGYIPSWRESWRGAKSERLTSKLTVHNALTATVNKADICGSIDSFQVLFGPVINAHEITLCSFEETQGKTCVTIEISHDGCDITIEDQRV